MSWRKVNVAAAAAGDNAASFVNATDERLHIRKIVLRLRSSGSAAALGDNIRASIDEVPVAQGGINDSRSHIIDVDSTTEGGTGAVDLAARQAQISFPRNGLVLDPDEALYLNITDVSGTPPFSAAANIWYED